MNKYLILCLALSSATSFAKTVRYDLTIRNEAVNLSGKKQVNFALTVNGGIPAPTLEFTEGDDAEITVTNNIDSGEEASIHWHGILLPPEEDGVSYVNTPPILKGQSRTFRFKIRQHGTYWYHSHTMLQEQKGVYGAFIIHPKKKTLKYDKDIVAVLSDWSDENADKILKNLRKDGDYYLFKKNSIRSIFGAARTGGLGTYFKNEWIRMGGMDLSDVGYDAFLINGKKDSQLGVIHPGERVRLRIINAGASSYFYVSLAGLPMTIVSADGVDIEPVQAKEILMGMAETYDVIFSVPEHKNFELRATVQDLTGHASAWLGMGDKLFAPDKSAPNLYAGMDHSSMGHGSEGGGTDHSKMDHSNMSMPMDHSTMDHSKHQSSDSIVETLTVDNLKSPSITAFSKNKKIHDVKLVLGGDMERYVWHINGKAMYQDRTIEIKEGEVVRFTLANETMMHHPMHLHGHFFRVLNANGDNSPLKHTVDVGPHMTRTIEFYANEPGQWMLHCHNLYHMKTGMARVVKYSSWEPSPEMKKHEKHDSHLHDHWYHYGKLALATQRGEAFFRSSQTWNQLELRVEAENQSKKMFGFDKDLEYQGDLFYRRWFGQFLNVVGGGTYFDEKFYGSAGVAYTLPMLVESQLLVDHEGQFRLNLEKKFQWTSHVYSELEFTWRPNTEDHKTEYKISLMYAPNWSWAAGFLLSGEKLGVGLEMQF
ncbi:MAG: multicopper oxidase domain-containing protein [Proteobacteria bacterium]|nr:multicopper oxidase domain-containing protein [Pseudomonadota bacterium]